MTGARAPGLTVVIPAYNEERRLGPTLRRVRRYLATRGRTFEILVVDDGSDDRTAEVARSADPAVVRLVALRRHRGKGAAVRAGVGASRGDLILITDADLSTPIDELECLEARLTDASLSIGSRALETSRVEIAQPPLRRLLGKVFRRVVALSGVSGVRDSQCGFKLLPGPLARDLFPHMVCDGFAWDVELLWMCQRCGVEIEEVGVRWLDDASSTVRPLRDSLAMLIEIFRFRRHQRHLDVTAIPLRLSGRPSESRT